MNGESFACNLCGEVNSYSGAQIHREMLFCRICGSTARFRGILLALQKHFFPNAAGAPIRKLPPLKQYKGLGFSDWAGYVGEFNRIFDHIDTYLHKEPRLDLMDAHSVTAYGQFDYVICSEVLEHVVPPAIHAFEHLRTLVARGGALILSVPFLEGYETIEHFPHLNQWEISTEDSTYVLNNVRPDGLREKLTGLQFHGGPGTVLEMRIYGEQDLINRLRYAGFNEIEVIRPNLRSIGYLWEDHVESPMHQGRRQRGHILICK
jgi:SAM-dependent methyltransferase